MVMGVTTFLGVVALAIFLSLFPALFPQPHRTALPAADHRCLPLGNLLESNSAFPGLSYTTGLFWTE